MQKEIIGEGSLNKLQEIIDTFKAKRIFLVTGKKSFSLSGAEQALSYLLKDKKVVAFDCFQSNPKLKDVRKGVELLECNCSDLIISVGGGSVIDMAKSINILTAQGNANFVEIIKNPSLINDKGLPLVAIPTTSGSGSQATSFAVVYINKKKYSLSHDFMLPDYAIVDPELTYSMSKNITAISGIDALSQSVESYWSIKSTNISKKYSARAIILILQSLKDAVYGSKIARRKMSEAAHLAGKAINIANTTAAHAISYPITTYFGVPHGLAVALTLGKFFKLNFSTDDCKIIEPRGEAYLKDTMKSIFKMFNASSAEECEQKWNELLISIGLEDNVKAIGIDSERDIDIIIKNVNSDRMKNNPVLVDNKFIKQVLL